MRGALVLLAWLVAIVTKPAVLRAEGPRAVIMAEQSSEAELAELSARLRGELSAAGFSVSSAASVPGVAPRAAISTAPADAVAVILVRGELRGAEGVELWISDRVLGATSNARLASDHPDPSERARRISVEAAELLRARLAELLLHRAESTKADATLESEQPAPTPAVPVREPPEPARPWLAAGLGMLAQPDQDQVTLLPSLSAGLRWESMAARSALSLAIGASVSGYGQALRYEREQGEVELRQGVGTVDVVLSWLMVRRVAPELSLSGGVYGVGLRGEGVAPFEGRNEREFSAALGAGVGLRLRLFSFIWLRAVTGPLRALDETKIMIADAQVATAGGLFWSSRVELWAAPW